jgi:hypothetical protein
MKISWIFSDAVDLDPVVDITQLKNVGCFWGSWRGWRAYQIDNVICHDIKKADELIKRNFQSVCNFYIPNSIYTSLDRPTGVKLYEGEFVHDMDRHEEIVSMHLAAMDSDIVLLLGFNFCELEKHEDKLITHKLKNYTQLAKHAIMDNKNVQWVLIDHPGQLADEYADLANLTTDTLANTLELLK